ncbi:iron complex transport system permease protein [Pusillimonas noertemannii]|uniref:Iron complex transport system permease protein n=1 Tax=Pusillimonas noertemannii TaxID=305977 RepID=A0A2U1CM80_9BURK|nr:Fe(3+)-hydroxamate ABC transporter permease FhuB [Pusillimonas noertemannii]PVY62115.1 iron complex transport system permease protein [Pusillimonas noertemannii]
MPRYSWPVVVILLSALIALCLSLRSIVLEIPLAQWLAALTLSNPLDLQQLVVREILLPRIAISILAGAALALSGVIFQQMLRNPLAEATTLGVASGAGLALKIGILWFPNLVDTAQEGLTFTGAALALGLTFFLAWRDAASPLRLILAGLIVSLFLGVVSSVLALFFHEQLRGMFLWSSGTLQNVGWDASIYLAPRFALCFGLALLLVRPFSLLALADENARSLGIPLAAFRILGMLLAVALAAFVVSAVGMIGFLGIAAPALVRLAGVRTYRARMLASIALGGVLLWLADQLTQVNPFFRNELPTGIVTAILGGPLMLWMLPKLRGMQGASGNELGKSVRRLAAPWLVVTAAVPVLCLAAWAALALGQNLAGWNWSSGAQLDALLPWRWPRVTAALAAGAMMAMSGTLVQRMTGNAMASPEILGISSGATLGVVMLFFFEPVPNHALKIGVAGLSAFVTLVVMLSLARRSAYSPERMILTGVALGTVLGALLSLAMISGDPRLGTLLAWMGGSTYAIAPVDALIACGLAVFLGLLIPLTVRWLDVLPLGEVTARALGVSLAGSRLAILVMTAILTGGAVLIVGPLSFVGLMGPHIARMAGFQRALSQLVASAMIGALIMVVADWLGRNLLFPYQIPAGILATLIGGPYFMWLMWRKTP